jgi:hypothetical protein
MRQRSCIKNQDLVLPLANDKIAKESRWEVLCGDLLAPQP